MYSWLVYLHVLGTFGFVMAHGVSAAMSFALRKERRPEGICALLGLSGGSYSVMYISLLVLLISGIVTGFMGKWWGGGWIWTSLGLLIALIVYMGIRGSNSYGPLRKAVGLEYFENWKPHPPVEPLSAEEVNRLLDERQGRPWELMVVGFGGLAVILWLMMFRPTLRSLFLW